MKQIIIIGILVFSLIFSLCFKVAFDINTNNLMLVLPEAERKIYAALVSIKSENDKRVADFDLLLHKVKM